MGGRRQVSYSSPRAPGIGIIPTLGPKVHGVAFPLDDLKHLLWAA